MVRETSKQKTKSPRNRGLFPILPQIWRNKVSRPSPRVCPPCQRLYSGSGRHLHRPSRIAPMTMCGKCPSTAAWYRWDLPIPVCFDFPHGNTFPPVVQEKIPVDKQKFKCYSSFRQVNIRFSAPSAYEPSGENSESCKSHERYRHCKRGGAAPGENRPLGSILRRLCSSEDA